MASNKGIEERVQALVAELLAEEAAMDLEGRRGLVAIGITINDTERGAKHSNEVRLYILSKQLSPRPCGTTGRSRIDCIGNSM